jgi:hypothetical protein
MLWKEPVNSTVDLEKWLQLGDFPPGLMKHAMANYPKRKDLSQKLLEGGLVLVKKRKNVEGNTKILSMIVVSAKDHADVTTFFQGYRAPYLVKSFHPKTDEDDMTELDDVLSVDLLVVTALEGMTADEAELLDRLLTRRAFGSPKITVILMPGNWDKHLIKTIEAHEERVVRL